MNLTKQFSHRAKHVFYKMAASGKRGGVIEITLTGRVELDWGSPFCTGATIISSRSSDLAKLNLICHMNYLNYL